MRFFKKKTYQPVNSDVHAPPSTKKAKRALRAFKQSNQNRVSTEEGKPPQYAVTTSGGSIEQGVKKLLDIATLLEELRHPNIIQQIVGDDRAAAFQNLPLVLPFYHQMTLEHFINECQKNPQQLPNHTAKSFSVQVASALAYLADQNTIHWCVTPENIFLTDDRERLVLSGFSNSTKIKMGRDGHYPTQSVNASMISYRNSKPGYRSPLLMQSHQRIQLTPNLDQPGLGITLLQLISRTMAGPHTYSFQPHSYPALDTLYTFYNDEFKKLILNMYSISPSHQLYIHAALQWLKDTNADSFQADFRNPMPVDRAPHYRAAIFPMHEITASLSSFNTYTSSYAYKTIHGGTFGAIIRSRDHQEHCAKIALNKKNTCSVLFEVSILKPLNHPNIIQLANCTKYLKNLPLVMSTYPYNLKKYVEEHKSGRKNSDHSHSLHDCAIDIAHGLNYLSQQGIIHGDLKPNNVLVSEAGSAVLADFGMSLRLAHNQSTLILNNAFRYIQPFRPPEIKRDQQHFSTGCDIYAFGIMLLELARRQELNIDFFIGTYQRRPAGIHPGLYNLIYNMTRVLTSNRPTAKQVAETLEKLPKSDTFRLYRASHAQTRQDAIQPFAASCA